VRDVGNRVWVRSRDRFHHDSAWLWLSGLLLMAVGAGCRDGSGTSGSAKAETTERVYELHCLGCHGARGEGISGSNIQGLKSSVEQIGTVIADGVGKMPGFKGHLSEAQIHSLSEYVKAFKLPEEPKGGNK
jgi:mono/diheme cytochrome c family protein